jgi:hypothetical protein
VDDEFVWLDEKRVYAKLVQLGAHASLVRYSDGINNYEVWVTNDEFEFIEPEEADAGTDN